MLKFFKPMKRGYYLNLNLSAINMLAGNYLKIEKKEAVGHWKSTTTTLILKC